MKRRIATTLGLVALAVLCMASVAHAATKPAPTVTLSATGSGNNSYALTCKVRHMTKVKTIQLHYEVQVWNGSTLVGTPCSWTNLGSRKLAPKYGNGGYWTGSVSIVIAISPPVMPGDTIVISFVTSYGTGKAKVNSPPAPVDVTA